MMKRMFHLIREQLLLGRIFFHLKSQVNWLLEKNTDFNPIMMLLMRNGTVSEHLLLIKSSSSAHVPLMLPGEYFSSVQLNHSFCLQLLLSRSSSNSLLDRENCVLQNIRIFRASAHVFEMFPLSVAEPLKRASVRLWHFSWLMSPSQWMIRSQFLKPLFGSALVLKDYRVLAPPTSSIRIICHPLTSSFRWSRIWLANPFGSHFGFAFLKGD